MAKVDLNNLKSNAYSDSKPKKEELKIKQVAQASIVRRKKPLLASIFNDTFRSVGTYVLWDVVLPSLKEIISDVINNGLEMMLYGDQSRSYRSGRLSRNKGRTYVSYNSMFDDKSSRRRRYSPDPVTITRPQRHSFDDVVFGSRADAEQVLGSLVELIDVYELATVADFYTAAGLDSDWNDHKFGWDNLASSEVRRVREGYVLVLPSPLTLD